MPFFQGDNFGATYMGVTRNQITVLVYMDQGNYGSGTGLELSPGPGTYVDLDAPSRPPCPADDTRHPASECDFIKVREMKGFSHYFNARFQTYGRHIHYWGFFSGATNAPARRGDAGYNVDKLHPFAVIDEAVFTGNNEEYDTAMNQHGVLTFGSTYGSLPNAFYRKHAPLAWGFYPDIEHWARMYSSYVCEKVAPFPVSHYGGAQGTGPPNGGKRVYGFWYADDPAYPGLRLFAKLVKQQLADCGVKPRVEHTFSHNGFVENTGDTGTEGATAAADFQSKGVTTVLYMGGMETNLSRSADTIRYYPEIVVAGSLVNDGNSGATFQNPNVWRNAWVTTYTVREGSREESPGYRAYKEGNPSGDEAAAGYAILDYRDHFSLAEGIQIAGPRLTPQTMDQGYHAIPPHTSKDPFSPSLYFDPGDYTAMKDAQEGWWDPNGQAPGGSASAGCWRLVRNGQRFTPGHWPHSDDAFRNASDPCTAYAGGINVHTGNPAG